MTRRQLLQRASVGALALYGIRSIPASAPVLPMAINDCQIFSGASFCAPVYSSVYTFPTNPWVAVRDLPSIRSET